MRSYNRLVRERPLSAKIVPFPFPPISFSAEIKKRSIPILAKTAPFLFPLTLFLAFLKFYNSLLNCTITTLIITKSNTILYYTELY